MEQLIIKIHIVFSEDERFLESAEIIQISLRLFNYIFRNLHRTNSLKEMLNNDLMEKF